MCYKFGISINEKYQFEWLAQTDTSKSVPYIVELNRTLLGKSKFLTVIINDEYPPNFSRYYASTEKLLHAEKLSNTIQEYFPYNYRVYSYSTFSYDLLPHPYDTGCGPNYFDERNLKQSTCKQICLLKKVQDRLHLVPYNHIIADSDEVVSFDLKLLSHYLLQKNDTLLREYVAIVVECDQQCSRLDCQMELFNTDFVDSDQNPKNDSIALKVLLPLYPTISFRHLPVYYINDYVLLWMSCLGTWLGVSMIDIDPIALYWRYRDRNASARPRSTLRRRESVMRCVNTVARHERLLQIVFELIAAHRVYRHFNPIDAVTWTKYLTIVTALPNKRDQLID